MNVTDYKLLAKQRYARLAKLRREMAKLADENEYLKTLTADTNLLALLLASRNVLAAAQKKIRKLQHEIKRMKVIDAGIDLR